MKFGVLQGDDFDLKLLPAGFFDEALQLGGHL